MSGAAPMPLLHVYRHILKAAKYFPSIKRDRIIAGIKTEFKENKVRGCSDGARLW